jgi:hypothetical protein
MNQRSVPDWTQASPEEIEESIAVTRASLDRHLEQLKGKFAPRAKLRKAALPMVIAAAGLIAGGLVWAFIRRDRHPVQARISRIKIRSMGVRDRIHALRLVMAMIRKGKPAVFIVEPGKG